MKCGGDGQRGGLLDSRVRLGEERGKYLGLSFMIGRKKKEVFNYIKDRVLALIHNWNSQFRSRARREVLLKVVLQALPMYVMNILLFLGDLCEELERAMNGYWCVGGGKEKKGICWCRWALFCTLKRSRGMEYRYLREFNLAMLGSHAWKLVKNLGLSCGKDF